MNLPTKFRDLIATDVTVRTCMMHHKCGDCTLEDALIAMVVMLHERAQGAEKQAVDAMLCERVVYIKPIT